MRFHIGDMVTTKHAVGIFERGQIGTVCDCMNGEVLFESGEGQLQWIPEDRFELVPPSELVSEAGPSVLHVLGVAVGLALLASALIWIISWVANYLGIGC